MTKPSPRRLEPHVRGELQRRIDAIIATGVLGTLPKPSLVVFLQLRQWADFKTCATRPTSIRTLAKHAVVPKSTAWKGVQGLLDSGALTAGDAADDGRRVFTFQVPNRRAVEVMRRRTSRRPPRGGDAHVDRR